jgi:hypothetical protein
MTMRSLKNAAYDNALHGAKHLTRWWCERVGGSTAYNPGYRAICLLSRLRNR